MRLFLCIFMLSGLVYGQDINPSHYPRLVVNPTQPDLTIELVKTNYHLQWQASTDTEISGYNIYYGIANAEDYDDMIQVGNITNFVTDDFPTGVAYRFAVSTRPVSGDSVGESDLSKDCLAASPMILKVKPHRFDDKLQTTINFRNWNNVTQDIDPNGYYIFIVAQPQLETLFRIKQ